MIYEVIQRHRRQADCRVAASVVDPQQAVLDDVARREDDVRDKEAELFIVGLGKVRFGTLRVVHE